MVYKVKVNGIDIEVGSLKELSFLGVQLSEEPNVTPPGLKSLRNGNGNGNENQIWPTKGLRSFKSNDFIEYENCIHDIYCSAGSRQEIVDMVKLKYNCEINPISVSSVRSGRTGKSVLA